MSVLPTSRPPESSFKDGVVHRRGFHKSGSGAGIYRVPWSDSFLDSKNNRRYGVRLDYYVGWVWNASGTGRFPKTGHVDVYGTLTAAQRDSLER